MVISLMNIAWDAGLSPSHARWPIVQLEKGDEEEIVGIAAGQSIELF